MAMTGKVLTCGKVHADTQNDCHFKKLSLAFSVA